MLCVGAPVIRPYGKSKVAELNPMPSASRRLNLLEKQLAQLPGDDEPMLVSELDGFLAGILVCPDLITPSEWLPIVWGGEDDASGPVFEDAEQMEKLVGLVMEHYNAIATDLQRGRYAPVFHVDSRHNDVLWELWIDGFDRAMQMRPESWSPLLEADEDAQIAIAGMAALSAINQGDESLSGAEVDELSRNAPDLIAHWVMALNAWRTGQFVAEPALRSTKVGRNDPCPCGSGKKYKKCCGLN